MSDQSRAGPGPLGPGPVGPYLPGVTRVLSSTLTPLEADLLRRGAGTTAPAAVQPGHKSPSRLRGDALHGLVRAHLRREVQPPVVVPSVLAFWPSLQTVLDSFSGVEWAEGGIQPQGESELALGNPWPGFRGTPDLVARRAGRRAVVEVKSSSGAYRRHAPLPGSFDPGGYIGWLKFREASLQLAAYSLLAKHRGLLIEDAVLLVALPGRTQQFTLAGPALENAEADFLKRLSCYGVKLKEEAQEFARGLRLAAADGLS